MVTRRYERRQKLAVERWKRRARKWQAMAAAWRKAAFKWLFLLVAALVLALAGFVLFSPVMGVRKVDLQRTDPRMDIEDVQLVLAPFFGRHLLFLPEHEVREALRFGVPDFVRADIGKLYPSTLVVRVELEPLRAQLKIAEPTSTEGPETQSGSIAADFLTEHGVYVFAPQANMPDLPVITLVDWGVRPVPGAVVLPLSFMDRLNATEAAIREQFGYTIEERTVFLRAQEFHLDIGPYELWFDVRSPLEEHLARYRTFLREVAPTEVKTYVDLRSADRVVYR